MNIKEINSSQNPTVKHMTKLATNRKYRETCQSTIIEGTTLIKELAIHVKAVFTVDIQLIPKNLQCSNVFLVSESILKKIANTKSPEGIIAEANIPAFGTLENKKYIVALDAVQDPGNLGTIIRTALAFGWEGLFLLEGCCDPWNDKAVRSSKGASFKLPMQSGSWNELLELSNNNHLSLIAADLNGSLPEEFSNSKSGKVLVLGNEGQGLSKSACEHCKKITIPMNSDMESLNVSVAGGILMYILTRPE